MANEVQGSGAEAMTHKQLFCRTVNLKDVTFRRDVRSRQFNEHSHVSCSQRVL